MLCQELEHLDSQFIAVRAAQRRLGVTHEQRRVLEDAEDEMKMTIAIHRCCGHDGERCFGE